LFEDQRIKCWGSSAYGQLGLGYGMTRGDQPGEMGQDLPTVDLGAGALAVALAASEAHTCALLEGGAVKCWGSNGYGLLGLGSTLASGDEPATLPTVDLGTGAVAVALAAGFTHTCALLVDGSVKCWGENLYGRLGLGDGQRRPRDRRGFGAYLRAPPGGLRQVLGGQRLRSARAR
jgi:alpha-tubulin suppressor-like RCC1 family protein